MPLMKCNQKRHGMPVCKREKAAHVDLLRVTGRIRGGGGGRAVLGRHWDAGQDRFPDLRDAYLNDTCI